MHSICIFKVLSVFPHFPLLDFPYIENTAVDLH